MARKRQKAASPLNPISGIVGAILLVVALVWAILLVFHPSVASRISSSIPIIGAVATTASQEQIAPLQAEGITLGHPAQTPALTEQQALLIVNQLMPDAATQAKSTKASYVLLNYPVSSDHPNHTSFNNVPAWMIVYQQIPVTSSSQSHQDLYVFLDANTGKELLAIWV
jgi:hypothetical protein